MRNFEKPVFRAKRALVFGGFAALMITGCATTGTEVVDNGPTSNVYAGAHRTNLDHYIRDLPERDISADGMAQLAEAEQTQANENLILDSYSGVEGARLAHQIFAVADAEKLDGACERYVKITNGETLNDISQYCDVSLNVLMSANPSIASPHFVEDGAIIAIPGGGAPKASGGIFRGAGAGLTGAYVVQPGDSLSKIAYTLDASATDLMLLNRNVNWTALPVGQTLVTPVSNKATNIQKPTYAPSGQSDNSYTDDNADYVESYGSSGYVEAPMPYEMAPLPGSTQPSDLSAVDKAPALGVSNQFLASGELVTLSGANLPPNSEITIYRGANGGSLKAIETVETDGDGKFFKQLPVSGGAKPGGIIFAASANDGKDKLLSPRVSVKSIKAE